MFSDGRHRDGLTAEERAVLELSATGAVLVEVAAALGMSDPEARAHLASAARALGAGSKLEAVLLALRHGLIRPPRPTKVSDAPSHSGGPVPGSP
jgi:DNA-binding CsgD family transcriptional regulator